MGRAPKQRELNFWKRGGRREGAGRPKSGRVSHATRPKFDRVTAVHVTLRVREHVWNLRSGRCFRRIAKALQRARGRFGLRVIEFSILGNHLHLIVEVDCDVSLTRGMQGLAIRIAKALNKLMAKRGRVFSDHYHAHLLHSPTEVVRALQYVFTNAQHHYGLEGRDEYTSSTLNPHERTLLLMLPLGWLLRIGFRRGKSSRACADTS